MKNAGLVPFLLTVAAMVLQAGAAQATIKYQAIDSPATKYKKAE